MSGLLVSTQQLIQFHGSIPLLGLNIGAHKEAVEHFLSALAMQDASGASQTSDQLWHTLRRALIQMVSASSARRDPVVDVKKRIVVI